ncbi:MAG: biotin--[acetyl-CoA-carboxylase] ligase [Sciscionella sp.]
MPEPLDAAVLRERLVPPYAALDVFASTGSTNAELSASAARGAADATVLLAEEQTAGQGRRSRQWVSPTGSGIYTSVLLRPSGVRPAQLGSLTLVAGVALVRAVRAVTGLRVVLKWPNDVLVADGGGKCAGVLAETVAAAGPPAVVLGMGLNVFALPEGVPAGAGGLAPTSLAQAGAVELDRGELAIAVLATLAELQATWRAAEGDLNVAGILAQYREYCATLGSRVRVELAAAPGPGAGATLTGLAEDVDATGALGLRTDDGRLRQVCAGDVVHLRPVRAAG